MDEKKRDILSLYRSDILKYSGALKHKELAVFYAIPSELSKYEKKLTLANIRANAKCEILIPLSSGWIRQ